MYVKKDKHMTMDGYSNKICIIHTYNTHLHLLSPRVIAVLYLTERYVLAATGVRADVTFDVILLTFSSVQ